jgi:hypothetical protein
MRDGKPDVPNLRDPEPQLAPHLKAFEEPETPDVRPRERYWTEDRVMRVGLMLLFAAFAVGLVVSLSRWDVIERVPFLPWLVGAGIVAGPAWKAYSELAEEQKARRTREERDRNGFGVNVNAPRDRHAG